MSSADQVLATSEVDINAFSPNSSHTTVSTVIEILLVHVSAIVCLNTQCLVAMARGRLLTEANTFIFVRFLVTNNTLLGAIIILQSSPMNTTLTHDQDSITNVALT